MELALIHFYGWMDFWSIILVILPSLSKAVSVLNLWAFVFGSDSEQIWMEPLYPYQSKTSNSYHVILVWLLLLLFYVSFLFLGSRYELLSLYLKALWLGAVALCRWSKFMSWIKEGVVLGLFLKLFLLCLIMCCRVEIGIWLYFQWCGSLFGYLSVGIAFLSYYSIYIMFYSNPEFWELLFQHFNFLIENLKRQNLI